MKNTAEGINKEPTNSESAYHINREKIIFLSLATIFTIATGIFYFAFQSIGGSSRWIMVPLGIISFSVAVYCSFQVFTFLQKYTSLVLALITGTAIFFLFLGDEFFPNPLGEFNDLLLSSSLATFQTDLTSIISVTFLQYIYIWGIGIGIVGIGVDIFHLKFNQREIKAEEQMVILRFFKSIIGILIIVSSLVIIILTSKLGLEFYIRLSSYFETRINFYWILFFTFLPVVLGVIILELLREDNDFLEIEHREYINKIVLTIVLVSLTLLIILFFWGVILGFAAGFEHGGSSMVTFPPGSASFAVAINEECSGIHSFTIFIACFYVAIIYTGRNYSIRSLIIALVVGTLGTLSGNWLRIIIIFLVGIIDTNLMWEVHNYAGLVIFLSWMLIFWFFALDFLEENQNEEESITSPESNEENRSGES